MLTSPNSCKREGSNLIGCCEWMPQDEVRKGPTRDMQEKVQLVICKKMFPCESQGNQLNAFCKQCFIGSGNVGGTEEF